jgi:hypothetical protein
MQKVKLLSERTYVEVEVKGIMIDLRSMTCQYQEIDLKIRKLENVSIVEKRVT